MENNEIKENKKNNITILIFVIIIIILIGVITYLLLKDNKKVNNQTDGNKNNEIALNIEKYEWLMTNAVIEQYVKSGSNNLASYLTNNLSNDDKLRLGGISDGVAFSDIQNRLNKYFGSDLGVAAKGFDLCIDEPYYIITNGIYKYNSAWECGSDGFNTTGIYLYKQKNIVKTTKGYEVTYYFLYDDSQVLGPGTLVNKQGKQLSFCNEDWCDIKSDGDLDIMFAKNKNDFFEITYVFEKTNDSYKLTDVKAN